MNHFCAMNVGITALAMTTPISREYYSWFMSPACSPNTLAIVPNVSPVLIHMLSKCHTMTLGVASLF